MASDEKKVNLSLNFSENVNKWRDNDTQQEKW